jgi:H+/Cl- antiporter ClcA
VLLGSVLFLLANQSDKVTARAQKVSQEMTTRQPTRQVVSGTVLAVFIGVVAAIAASAFLWLVEEATHLLYQELPHLLGIHGAPWWWAGILLFSAAAAVYLARKLPGGTGQGPLTGFHFDVALEAVPSILLAAFASLAAGIALGPEAPLIVVGVSVGGLMTRGREPQVRKAMMFVGGVAAICAVFGNPFITAFMVLEFMALGVAPVALLLPVLAALASAFVVSIGIWNIPGFGVHSLSVPGMPAYPTMQPGDLVAALIIAVMAALVALVARRAGFAVDALARVQPTMVLFGAAAVTTLALLLAESLAGANITQVLFSGNAGMPDLVAQTSVLAVVVILITKGLAYSVALGGGFRGGPIFPVTFLGVAVAVLGSLVLPDASVSALAAAGIAAAAAAFLKLPATSALLGTLLIVGAGAAITPFAIFGAVVGFVIRLASDARVASTEAPAESSAS